MTKRDKAAIRQSKALGFILEERKNVGDVEMPPTANKKGIIHAAAIALATLEALLEKDE